MVVLTMAVDVWSTSMGVYTLFIVSTTNSRKTHQVCSEKVSKPKSQFSSLSQALTTVLN